jgi:hypothetical protein
MAIFCHKKIFCPTYTFTLWNSHSISPMLAFCNWVTNNPPQFMLLIHCKIIITFHLVQNIKYKTSETKIYYKFNLMLTCMEYDNPFYWSSIIINNQICIFFHHVRIQKPL